MPNKRPLALSLFRGHVDYNSKDLLNTVTLFNVDKNFAGQYSCRVITEYNESENSAQMIIIVGNYNVKKKEKNSFPKTTNKQTKQTIIK